MAQIEIQNLTFTYAGAKTPALKHISLQIAQGDFVVVCGKSGCGKSTLLRNLKPAIRPHGEIQGEIYVDINEDAVSSKGAKQSSDAQAEDSEVIKQKTDALHGGKRIDDIGARAQAEKIGFVMQNPDTQIVTDKVWHELAFGLENLGYKTEEIRLRVAEMAEYFGITDWYYQSVEKLSGGQKQLLNLGAVMAMHPEIMILDEPTAQLDPIAAENFLDTLKKINRDLGITIILSEHRLENVLPDADKVLVMADGAVWQEGSPRSVLSKTMDEELLKLMPVSAQVFQKCVGRWKEMESGTDSVRREKQAHAEGTDSVRREKQAHADGTNTGAWNEKQSVPLSIAEGRKWIHSLNVTGEIPIKKEHPSEPVIDCRNLWFRYEKSGEDIIRGLNLEIRKGEIFCILGGNGTGKSTTMSLLSGIYRAYRGKRKIQGKVSALPQDVQTLFRKESVADELEGVPEEMIRSMELDKLLERHPYDISGGQQQKLALAKVLAQHPDILLLDEPTKGIDGIYKESLGNILETLRRAGKTIVMVSHDVDFCGAYATRCGLFAQGSLVAVSNVRDFFRTNRFYTTSVSKMAGQCIQGAVSKEDVVCFLTGENTI